MSLKSTFKGLIGEAQTKIVQTLLDPKYYQTYDNVLIKNANDSTQIDHIIVSRYGIFVVETKRWSSDSIIYGSLKDKEWTVFTKGGKSSRPNPIRQNYKHKMMLSEYLPTHPDYIFTIVYIWGGCKFKTEIPEGVICKNSGILNSFSYIKEIVSKKEIIFSDEEVSKFNLRIQALKNSTKLSDHIEHVQAVKAKHSEPLKPALRSITSHKQPDVDSNRCPRCKNGFLLERTSSTGKHAGQKFLGCSRFPKCRYKKDIQLKAEIHSKQLCKTCGTKLQDDFNFCYKCGEKNN